MNTEEYFFECPYCGETISMILDTSVEGQSYTEDCEVCCHPIEISYEVEDNKVISIETRGIND